MGPEPGLAEQADAHWGRRLVRFVSAERDGQQCAGVVQDGQLIPLRGVRELGALTSIDVLSAPPLDHGAAVPLSEVRLRPVIPAPGKIICLGLNYRGHAHEAGRELPEYPVLFTKFAAALIGPFDDIVRPPETEKMDFEVELAVVIGRAGRRISRARAMDHVAGLTVANDITMRDFQRRTPQWLQGKSWEASTPLGPQLVTLDEVDLAAGLDISLRLNGTEMQRSNTAALIFDIPTIIVRISEFTSLLPGDVILTGTPEGVGDFRDPPVRLAPGDRLSAEVAGVGALENLVVAEGADGG